MDQLQPGQTLGPYRIINQVGQGGMAAVYKAYQPSMDRNVAVKVLPGQLADSKEFIQRFQQEARIIARLEHAHILPVFDYGESDGVTYFVMRYLEAGTLRDKMEAGGQLSLNEIDRLFTQLADALSYAHSQGVVHRDLKPANALIDAQGDLFLTDFGIAKILESASPRLTQTDAIMGTPAYISPEQAQAQKVDQRSDIYSLGIILYEMVTGRVPFTADTPLAVILKHVSDPLPLPSSVKPDIPEAIERVILKALAKNPNDRFTTVAEFASAWKRALDVKDYAPTVVSSASQTPQTQGRLAQASMAPAKSDNGTRRIVGYLAGGILLLIILGGAYLAFNRNNEAADPPGNVSVDENTPPPAAGSATEESFQIEIGDEISIGEPDTGAGSIEAPGSTDVYTFTAESGEIVYFQIVQRPETPDPIDFYLTDDLGSNVFYGCLQCDDPGTFSLDRGGTYTMTVGNDDPNRAGYGTYRIMIWEVAPPDEFEIAFDDEISRDVPGIGAGYIENPGSTDAYTFTAESGQAVYFQVVEPPQTVDLINWSAFDDAGNAIFTTCLQCDDPGLIVLDRGGIYRIYVGNQTGAATGTYAIKIWAVPPPDEFEINIGDTVSNGLPADGAGFIEVPGGQDIYHFSGTAGQTITFAVTNTPDSSDLTFWRLMDEQGNELFNTCLQCDNPQPVTIEFDGTYTIIVGGKGPATGAYEFRVTGQ